MTLAGSGHPSPPDAIRLIGAGLLEGERRDDGYVRVNKADLQRTTDGGARYATIGPVPTQGISRLLSVTQSDGLALGSALLEAGDGGRTWSAVSL